MSAGKCPGLLPGHAASSPVTGIARTSLQDLASGGSVGTPTWQRLPTGTPPTPLSSHPIDALEGSDFASASTSTADSGIASLPALSDEQCRLPRSTAAQAPDDARHHCATASDRPVPTLGFTHEQPAWFRVDSRQEQQGSLSLSQGRHSLTLPSMSLDADAVMLELDSNVSVSADGIISPASSTASWPRDCIAQASSSSTHPGDMLACLPSATGQALDGQNQTQTHLNTGDSLSGDWYSANSRADWTTKLLNGSASETVSSRLPESWYSHHQQQQKQLLQQQLHSQHDLGRQSSRQANAPLPADYVAAAAQLRLAVAQAEQLYRVTLPTANQAEADDSLHVPGQVARDTPATEEDQSPAQGCLQQLPSALPQSRHARLQGALRRPAEPASFSQQPAWVPQGIACRTCVPHAASAFLDTQVSKHMLPVTCSELKPCS